MIVRETNIGAAALDAYLREKTDRYISREAIGGEILNATERETP